MGDRRRRPFLREAAVPLAASIACPAEDVLEDAFVLIERFFDKE